MAKGYLKAVGTKILHVFDETFYSIPTDNANCRYLVRLTSMASMAWYKPAKKGSSGGMPVASRMLKSAK